jgi:hypothetical protein
MIKPKERLKERQGVVNETRREREKCLTRVFKIAARYTLANAPEPASGGIAKSLGKICGSKAENWAHALAAKNPLSFLEQNEDKRAGRCQGKHGMRGLSG